MKTSRPNILMIMADQMPARTIGAYGHPVVRTPHLDALSARGARFDSAYTNCPICAPSRASMCAGRLVSGIGVYDNGAEFPAATPTFMHYLRGAGYTTELSGKMHFIGPDQLHGFERRLTPEIYPSSFVWTPDWTRGAYHNEGTSVEQLEHAGGCRWNMQLDYDEEVKFRAMEALRHYARGGPNASPFFLCASFTHPHDPFIVPEEWWDRYDHDEIDMPAVPPRPIDEMHPYDQWLQIHHMVDVRPPSEDEVRNARHAFYGMVSYVDDLVGALTGELERLGLADDTIIVFTSDHGEMLGEHGMWFKRTYFDPSTRVPLIVAGPGVGASEVASAVSLVDIFPTLLEIADVDAERDIETDGSSLCGLLSGEDSGHPGVAISEYYSEGTYQPMRMAVKDGLKYVYVHGEDELLFDLVEDPHETANVVADSRYVTRLNALRQAVHAGWDADATRADVLASQRRRMVINEANASGRADAWDVQPHFDAREQYVRREDSQKTNERRRL